jgi:hypothetical protein
LHHLMLDVVNDGCGLGHMSVGHVLFITYLFLNGCVWYCGSCYGCDLKKVIL